MGWKPFFGAKEGRQRCLELTGHERGGNGCVFFVNCKKRARSFKCQTQFATESRLTHLSKRLWPFRMTCAQVSVGCPSVRCAGAPNTRTCTQKASQIFYGKGVVSNLKKRRFGGQ